MKPPAKTMSPGIPAAARGTGTAGSHFCGTLMSLGEQPGSGPGSFGLSGPKVCASTGDATKSMPAMKMPFNVKLLRATPLLRSAIGG